MTDNTTAAALDKAWEAHVEYLNGVPSLSPAEHFNAGWSAALRSRQSDEPQASEHEPTVDDALYELRENATSENSYMTVEGFEAAIAKVRAPVSQSNEEEREALATAISTVWLEKEVSVDAKWLAGEIVKTRKVVS